MINRLMAEAIGTFWLVFAGCGSALLSAAIPQLGIGVFGLAVVTMVYALGHISGAHLNPAVSVGLMLSKRFPAHEVPGYIAAQVIGGILRRRGAIHFWLASAPKRCSPSCSS